jgi:hypothetical protein
MASHGLERRAFSLRRRQATVWIGPPIDLTNLCDMDRIPYKEITESLLESIRRLPDANKNFIT